MMTAARHILNALLLAMSLACCKESSEKRNSQNAIHDTAKVVLQDGDGNKRDASSINNETESILELPDSLFQRSELHLEEITKTEFENYMQNAKKSSCISSGGFIGSLGLLLDRHCNDICLTYLEDTVSGKKLLLPSSYDAGVAGISFSPSCDYFLVYSCYDGPDYDKYYAFRSEITEYKTVNAHGLLAIKPAFLYYSKEWSISGLVWINNSQIALKTYKEEGTDETKMQYKFFKASLNSSANKKM